MKYPSSITMKLCGNAAKGIPQKTILMHAGNSSITDYIPSVNTKLSYEEKLSYKELILKNELSYAFFKDINPNLAKTVLKLSIQLRMVDIMKKYCR